MKAISSIIVLLITLLTGVKSLAQSNQIGEKQIAEINQLVEELSASDGFSGAILIAKGDEIIYQKAVGLADKANNRANNINTKFNLASMNKMFTGVAIAQLVEKKTLNYTDKLIKYLPQLSEKIFGNITIEHLLTHSSGTGNVFAYPDFMAIKDTAKTISTYVNLGINEPLLFEPGARFEYSHYGYVLLGAVIEKVSGMSYFDYVKKYIFKVAEMDNTDSYETDMPNTNLAIGYTMPLPMLGNDTPLIQEEKPKEPNTQMIEVKGTSAGGGYSTVLDLHKFSQALLTGKLLSREAVTNITTGKISMIFFAPPNVKPKAIPEIKYGYGFGESFKNGIRVIGHTGGAPGVDSRIDIYPDLGYTVVLLSNYDMATRPIADLIEKMLTKP